MPLAGRGMKLLVVNESFILIGLDNGTLAGWNLQTNVIDNLNAHSSGITHLSKFKNVIFSGTSLG